MDVLGQSQELVPPRKRVDSATVFKRFTKSVQDNGGDQTAYRESIVEETKELFDCDVDELYIQTGGKRGRRDTLPQPAQEAYMVNESISANELERHIGTIGGDSQEEVNDQIKAVVRNQSKQTRRWLPW
ncbi:hypothetical protein IQ260_18310 [Leptolyngbya cf. ectocarpi LEGE 11479]|uniref:Uncharacterized protein n=1 Tax=Leptolyngbya cf. ectocarpi LEGE 11479 TaxID=1828722 RepID=A0A929FBD5_LEPEC|nr:hypothetical protein [Leptolyngbya cf. ectocarpi LEGE 11479]